MVVPVHPVLRSPLSNCHSPLSYYGRAQWLLIPLLSDYITAQRCLARNAASMSKLEAWEKLPKSVFRSPVLIFLLFMCFNRLFLYDLFCYFS
jgi:hypothetical protein